MTRAEMTFWWLLVDRLIAGLSIVINPQADTPVPTVRDAWDEVGKFKQETDKT